MKYLDVLGSLTYVLTFGLCWGSYYLHGENSEEKVCKESEGGLAGLVMALLHLLCQDAFWAGVCTLLRIPVNLLTMSVIHAVSFILLFRKDGSWTGVHIRGKKYHWDWLDAAVILEVSGIVLKYCLSIFSSKLLYTYTNSDAGLHLREAVMVVRNQKVEGMFFSHFYNAMVIEIAKPFLEEVDWYKGFILADLLFQFLELFVFFVLLRRFAKGIGSKLLILAVIPMYYLAYPLNSFYFSFTYWGIGVMLVLYLSHVLDSGIKQGFTAKIKWQMMTGCFSLAVCYMLFAPVVFITCWLFLVGWAWKQEKSRGVCVYSLEVFFIPFVMGIYYCYFDFFGSQGTSLVASLGNVGGIYSNLIANFALLLPLMAYQGIYEARHRKLSPKSGLFFAFLGMALVMWCGVNLGVVSQYYFYKSYYPLWALGWIGVVSSVVSLWKNNQEIVWAWGSVYAACFFLYAGGSEKKFVSSMDEINKVSEHRTEFFDIYQWHEIYRSWGRQAVPESKLELYRWVTEYRKEDAKKKIVPLLTGEEDYKDCYFYEGIVGLDLGEYYGWRYSAKEIMEKLEAHEIEYVVVLKASEFMEENPDFTEDKEVVYETDCGYILKY